MGATQEVVDAKALQLLFMAPIEYVTGEKIAAIIKEIDLKSPAHNPRHLREAVWLCLACGSTPQLRAIRSDLLTAEDASLLDAILRLKVVVVVVVAAVAVVIVVLGAHLSPPLSR